MSAFPGLPVRLQTVIQLTQQGRDHVPGVRTGVSEALTGVWYDECCWHLASGACGFPGWAR